MSNAPSRLDRLPRPAKTALVLGAFAAGMVGVSYAAVPLYDLFCRVTGFGGTTQVADAAPVSVLEQTIKVRFDGNVARALHWDLSPLVTEIEVPIGQVTEVAYRAQNLSDADTYGTASFNVSPPQAGIYFNKMHCFCFELQHLGAHESADMGVVFFVDPAILESDAGARIDTITLSYTMFEADAPTVGAPVSDETARVLPETEAPRLDNAL